MIYCTEQLIEKYKNYSDPYNKISREVKKGNLVKIKRDLYCDDKNIEPEILHQIIYGPSYLSFDFALSRYGLIPEAIMNSYSCATFSKKRRKTYLNDYGQYFYQDVPENVFSNDVFLREIEENCYWIASPEKALCDKLYSIEPIHSIGELKALLFEDLRIDEDEFAKLDFNKILELAPKYKSTNLKMLTRFVKRSMKNEQQTRTND